MNFNMAVARLLWYTFGIAFVTFVCASSCPNDCECFGDIIDCSDKHLLRIPSHIPEWVKDLSLGKNPKIKITNDSFSHLPKLNSLSLVGMKLKELPQLGEQFTLKKLSLANNKIKSVNTNWLRQLASLRELSLSKNSIHVFDPIAWQHPNLRRIDLNGNRISTMVSSTTFNLPALTSLRLSRNDIADEAFRNLTELLPSLPNLHTLDLNRNSVRHLKGLVFQDLVNITLKTLKLRRNQLTQLGDGVFYGLESLTTLQLDNNANITEVSNGWLFGLGALKILTISHNKIGSIKDKAWEATKQLSVLDLSYNELGCRQTDPSFKGLHNLQELFLSHNCLANLDPQMFEQLSLLKTLDISHNQIQWSVEDSTGTFQNLVKLEYLNLSHNKIETIHPDVFQPLKDLTRLDLSGNHLKTLSQNPFKHLPKLYKLHFNTSSLVCNCQLSWLPTWLSKQSFQGSVEATCDYPKSLKGHSVMEVSPEEFSCDVTPQPQISTSPHNQTVLFGHQMTLECIARTGGDQPDFIWTKDREIQSPYRVNTFMSVEKNLQNTTDPIFKVVSHLTLSNITHAHAGMYQCIVRDSFGPSYSRPAKIVVHQYPFFTRTPISITVKEGNVAELNCSASGYPVPQISWKKQDDEFRAAKERRLHYLPGDSVSYIKPVLPKDTGIYVCTAKNEAGSISIAANVTVTHTPNFSRPLSDQAMAGAGQSVVLECQGTGRPKPTVTWYKDGQLLSPNPNLMMVDEGQFLLLLQVTEDDAGTYRCTLGNALGAQNRQILLTVKRYDLLPTKTELIILIVVACVVMTSLFWVCIIYKTRRHSKRHPKDPPTAMQHMYAPQMHGVTKAPKGGGEANRTPLLNTPSLEPHVAAGQDSSSEHSSGKDSGVGESGHRSSEDLRKNGDLNLRRSRMMFPDSTSTLKSSVAIYGEIDDLKPRLSTFGLQTDGSRAANYQPMYASLRRGSASRLCAVPTPLMPAHGMSLPRHAYRSHSGSLSHPKSRKSAKRNAHTVTPPLFMEKNSWKDDQAPPTQRPYPNFYSDQPSILPVR